MFDFNVGILRWSSNLGAYCRTLARRISTVLLRRRNVSGDAGRTVRGEQSRLRLFVRFFAIIPNQIVLWFVQFAYFVTTFIAWWAILLHRPLPRGLHGFAVGVQRWGHRQASYLYLLRDEYPPYSTSADAKPGNEVVSAIIGFPILLRLCRAVRRVPVRLLSRRYDGRSVPRAWCNRADQPSAHTRSLEITSHGLRSGAFNVAFDVEARQRGRLPAVFAPVFFTLETCDGLSHPVESTEGDAFNWYWRDGEDQAIVSLRRSGKRAHLRPALLHGHRLHAF